MDVVTTTGPATIASVRQATMETIVRKVSVKTGSSYILRLAGGGDSYHL